MAFRHKTKTNHPTAHNPENLDNKEENLRKTYMDLHKKKEKTRSPEIIGSLRVMGEGRGKDPRKGGEWGKKSIAQ